MYTIKSATIDENKLLDNSSDIPFFRSALPPSARITFREVCIQYAGTLTVFCYCYFIIKDSILTDISVEVLKWSR